MARSNERGLVVVAAAGDRTALHQLARVWWPQVRRWCLAELGDPVLAEDAAQDTLVRLVRYIGQFDVERPFAPWLRRLAGNAARDVRAKRSRQASREVAGDLETPVQPGRERVIDLKRAHTRAFAALSVLTVREREVFDLCDVQGLATPAAAEQLGIAPATIRVLRSRARTRLRDHLSAADPDLADLIRSSS